MTVTIVLPFHQDERLAADVIPFDGFSTVEPDLPDSGQWHRLTVLFDALADAVAAAHRQGPVVVLTGDCLAGTGTLAGLQRAGVDPGVVWFDAHGDSNTLASSTSGYLGGTSLRMLMGGDPERLTGPLGLRAVAQERCVLVGARDLDPAERDFLAGSPVRRSDVEALTAQLLPEGPLLLHVDLDVADPEEVPGLLFPTTAGPTVRSVTDAVARVTATGRVAALEIACTWHAAGSPGRRQARRALLDGLIATVAG
ncbi:arginase family protein [Kineosporia sp. J2-2]|uniref:Arginase family protein n=1 Tax=Kineosporia corallincola TaxID=2835133 RepID=A0ABS5TSA7_9ACTN|nr:arginase family protein [Kineosporia corallincola]MBT0773672.1 arginase family protein [Kineosporia corallincola]